MFCRVCGNEMDVEQVVNVKFDEWSTSQVCNLGEEKPIEIYKCAMCLHRQMDYYLKDEYYETEGENSGGAIQYSGNLCKTKQRISRLRDFAHSKDSLIEIGCGAGYGLEDAKDFFVSLLGVDPCLKQTEVVRRKGFDVICGAFCAELQLQNKYSAFMSFQVFEHLEDLYSVLGYAYEILKDKGVGLINVPDGQYIFNNALYHQVISEHVNYFSPYSLSYMCNKAGFEILELNHCKDTMELTIYIRKNTQIVKMESVREEQRRALKNIISEHSNIGIYGAGAKANIYISLFEETDIEKIKYLFDSDKGKEGKSVSWIDKKVRMVSESLLKETDLIIIFASSYNAEIISTLKNQFSYDGQIVYFEDCEIKKSVETGMLLHRGE